MNPVFQPSASLKYRPEIDGLRTIAVLSVVLFHLGLPLHGGYVGVDIFFTISGFLIGSIIVKQVSGGTFTFAAFYERRIRRIFPALFAMLVASSILAVAYLLPVELVSYEKSVAAASLSVSNFYFWLQSGYFESPASSLPLLHTWSLAVEEQFYLFFPPLLVLLRRYWPDRLNACIYAVAACSFVASVWGVRHYASATFYLPHTRAWELLLGTMLALEHRPRIHSRMVQEVLSAIGLLLIGVSILLYHDWTPFPGLAAVPPCLGTALIIAAGESGRTLVTRLLSLRPVVFVGLISYSLYLWHWPLLVYYRFGFTIINGLSRHEFQLMLFALAVGLAVLSWRFIELPFRSREVLQSRKKLFGYAAAMTVALCGISFLILEQGGIPSRFPEQARRVAMYIDNDPIDGRDQYRNGVCFITSERATLQDFAATTCLPERPGGPTILVIGDSHAAALWWGFDKALPRVNVMQATASGCKPVIRQRPRQHAGCAALMSYVLTQYLLKHHVDAVLLEAKWDEGDIESLGETINWLLNHQVPVFLMGPIVQYDTSLPRLLAFSIADNDPALPREHLETFVAPLDAQLSKLSRQVWHVPYISMYGLFCRPVCTEYAAPGIPLQSDYGHLTKVGSELAATRILQLGVLPEIVSRDSVDHAVEGSKGNAAGQ